PVGQAAGELRSAAVVAAGADPVAVGVRPAVGVVLGQLGLDQRAGGEKVGRRVLGVGGVLPAAVVARLALDAEVQGAGRQAVLDQVAEQVLDFGGGNGRGVVRQRRTLLPSQVAGQVHAERVGRVP